MQLRKDLTSRWIFEDVPNNTYLSAAVVQSGRDESVQDWNFNILNQHYSNLTREQVENIRDFLTAILADSED